MGNAASSRDLGVEQLAALHCANKKRNALRIGSVSTKKARGIQRVHGFGATGRLEVHWPF